MWQRTRLHQSPSSAAQPSPPHPPNKSQCHQSPQLARPCASATAVPFALAAPHWPHPALAIGAWLVRTAAATKQGDNVSCPLTPRIFLCLASPEPRRFTDDPKGSASAVPARKGEQSKPPKQGRSCTCEANQQPFPRYYHADTRNSTTTTSGVNNNKPTKRKAESRNAAMARAYSNRKIARERWAQTTHMHTHSAHSHHPSPPPLPATRLEPQLDLARASSKS